MDVRPHPHIGLSTVTYLFDGEIMHRDSLGTELPIRPGELNWMTAGRGIVHSERTPPELRPAGSGVFGIQAWVALPRDREEVEPSFAHHDRSALPVLSERGFEARLIVGAVDGARAPVEVHSAMFYVDVKLEAGGRFRLPKEHEERAAYVVSGAIAVDGAGGASFGAERLVVFAPGVEIVIEAVGGAARVMLLGGAPMDGPRHLFWNFVSSSSERIEQAKADWKAGRFAPIPGETEFIPLPGEPVRPVTYP
jgi:redox-sensitive bicupin YhaK (pirin superfamily)